MRIQALVVAATVLATVVNAEPLCFESEGIVDIEAEGYSNKIDRVVGATSFQWQMNNALAGYSGTGYMEALPNVGTNLNATWVNTSPELQYAVSFSNAVSHFVWIRGFAFTNTEDSVHAGLNGTTNTAGGITLAANQTNLWAWTRTNISGGNATLSVGTTGVQTFSLWMREDGMRVDRIVIATNATTFPPVIGNAWHIPDNPEPNGGLPSMRVPVIVASASQPVTLYNGNQFQGTGNAADQATSQTFIYYKHETNTTWTQLPVGFYAQGGNNKYFSNSIPANAFNSGDTVQYYWKIGYADRLPTYLYGNDSSSSATRFESVAQQNPFTFTYGPGGSSIDTIWGSASDKIKARLFTNSGFLQIIGQALDGTELGLTNTFLPGSATVGGVGHTIGAVVPGSFVSLANGFEIRQTFGATNVLVRVTSPYQGVTNVVHYEVVDWGGSVVSATTIGAPSDASEHFYGFGEKFNDFDQAGKKVRMLNVDRFGDKGDDSYKVAPWFVSTKGYGLHLDSSALSYFDMRNQFSDRYVISNFVTSSFSGYVTNALKFNIVVGPKLTDVLTRYTGYTGRPSLPPKWAFAPWMSSDIWHNGGEIRYLISRYRASGIPGSVLVFDSPWEKFYNDYNWNTNQWAANGTFENVSGGGSSNYAGFATVGDMMTFFRTNGFYVMCWMTPFINTNSNHEGVIGQNDGQSPNYAEAAASNYFVRASSGGPPLVRSWWKGNGSPVDFTNPNAALWVQKQLSNLVFQSQSGGFNVIGGFKTDDGESGHPPEDNGDVYIPTTAVYFDGRTGVEMRNAYALEYHRTIWNVLGTNGILFARSGFTGSQAYPSYWAGDNEPNFTDANGMGSVVVAGQSAAMSGFAIWAHDTGGYQDNNFETDRANLFMRWTQFGALSPIMQMHRKVDVGQQYPWSFGGTALTNYQYFTRLHTALFPYIYSYAKEASTNGLPIFRPLVLLNQSDATTYGIKHTWYFGNELLTASMESVNQTIRNVYLPQGKWHNFFTNVTYTGGQNIVWTNANQSQMPLFVRDGAIIPMISTNVMTLCDAAYVSNPNLVTMDNSLQFLVYPATDSNFTVYDGTSLQCQSNVTVVTATLFSNVRPILMRFRAAQPFGVERDGVPLQKFTSAAGFATNSLGWYYDAGSGFVNVKFSHAGGTAKVMFGPDSVGDGISDSWRTNFFGSATTTNDASCAQCDPDGDGLNNAQEYRAGTDPNNANSTLILSGVALQVVGGTNNFRVTWPSQIGIHYRVLYKDEMSDAVPWQTNSSDFSGNGSVLNWFDDGTATGSPPENSPTGKRFYKIIVP